MPQLSEACAVLTAAGSGSRLGCELPKALVSLSGRPLVWWAARGLRAGGVGMIVVTAPASSIEDFRAALADIEDVLVVAGSDRSRQASVALGLAALGHRDADAVVLVHDAARPLTPPEVSARVIDAVRGGASAVIPVLPVTDTLKTVDASGLVTLTWWPCRPRRASDGTCSPARTRRVPPEAPTRLWLPRMTRASSRPLEAPFRPLPVMNAP